VSEVLMPVERRPVGWPTAVALVLLAWAAGLPLAYLLILLHLRVPHVVLPLVLVGWAVVSVLLTLRVRSGARRGPGGGGTDGRRAAFVTLPQRAALLMNAALLAAGAVVVVLVAVGGVGFSRGRGPDPGMLAAIVWGFLLLAATVPTAVLNGLWSLDRRTAAEEAAVLRGRRSGARGVLRFARVLAAVTWIAYGALAVLLLVSALIGSL
jgi:hypothetical protein